MTNEEKQLLFKDLSGRLLYKVCFKNPFFIGITNTLVSIEPDYNNDVFGNAIINGKYKIELIKPYLRPMSSMTREERKMVCTMNALSESELDDRIKYQKMYVNSYTIETFDLFNSHHFDYRGLIKMGLALEAIEGMYE